jgi:hypothetical protein
MFRPAGGCRRVQERPDARVVGEKRPGAAASAKVLAKWAAAGCARDCPGLHRDQRVFVSSPSRTCGELPGPRLVSSHSSGSHIQDASNILSTRLDGLQVVRC